MTRLTCTLALSLLVTNLAFASVSATLPVSFEANRGQTDSRVKFLSRGPGYTLFLTATEATFALRESEGLQRRLRMKLLGANRNPRVSGIDPLPGRSHYFIGRDPSRWRTGIPLYERVEYEEVYPGIDLVYYGNHRQLEYDFVVAPAADPRAITLAFDGADRLALDASGDLILSFAKSAIRLRKPIVYQTVDGQKEFIPASYRIGKRRRVSFDLGAYDRTRPLIIDPVLAYSTFLGGNGDEFRVAIAVDAAGNTYVAGATTSVDYPTTPGVYDDSYAGLGDVVVTKLNATGSALIYSTFLGGADGEVPAGIAVDEDGHAYVVGSTVPADFPTTPGSFDPTHNGGGDDAFVTKLAVDGSALVYSTFLGSTSSDNGNAIAVDGNQNAYVTGFVTGSDFPTTSLAYDTSFNGLFDAFVTRLNDTGSALIYSTFLGGTSFEMGRGIALDATGNAHIIGDTTSDDFPTTPAAFDQTFEGPAPAFVTKLDPTGSALVYSTFLGGTGRFGDVGAGIAVDAAGNAYATGTTTSADYPTTPGAFDTTLNGRFDAFVTKLNAAGSSLLYSTFLGGTADEFSNGIAVDADGNAHIVGATFSADFPTTPGAYDTTFDSPIDAFVTKLNAAGSALSYSTFLGGGGIDGGNSIALAGIRDVFVAGITDSADYPTTPGAFDTSLNGGIDIFVTKLVLDSSPEQQIADLVDLIDTFGLPGGIANSLTVKVQAALDSLAKGNPTAACNQLRALLNEAQALSGKKLTAAQAQAIVDAVRAIRLALGCS